MRVTLHRQPLLGGQALRGFAELDDWFRQQRDSVQADLGLTPMPVTLALADALRQDQRLPLTRLRDEPVYPGLQQRLDAALAAHQARVTRRA